MAEEENIVDRIILSSGSPVVVAIGHYQGQKAAFVSNCVRIKGFLPTNPPPENVLVIHSSPKWSILCCKRNPSGNYSRSAIPGYDLPSIEAMGYTEAIPIIHQALLHAGRDPELVVFIGIPSNSAGHHAQTTTSHLKSTQRPGDPLQASSSNNGSTKSSPSSSSNTSSSPSITANSPHQPLTLAPNKHIGRAIFVYVPNVFVKTEHFPPSERNIEARRCELAKLFLHDFRRVTTPVLLYRELGATEKTLMYHFYEIDLAEALSLKKLPDSIFFAQIGGDAPVLWNNEQSASQHQSQEFDNFIHRLTGNHRLEQDDLTFARSIRHWYSIEHRCIDTLDREQLENLCEFETMLAAFVWRQFRHNNPYLLNDHSETRLTPFATQFIDARHLIDKDRYLRYYYYYGVQEDQIVAELASTAVASLPYPDTI